MNFEGWRLISVRMEDTNGDGIPDSFVNASDVAYQVQVVNYRAPGGVLNFREVSLILAGVQRPQGQLGSAGEVWLHVIHLADAIILRGDAYKGDVEVK